MSETNGPVCAHMHIENRREESEFGRVTREWWECRDCRTEFRAIAPQPQPNAVTDAETRVLGDLDDVLIYEPYGFCEEPADVDMTRTDAFRDAVRALLASLATLRGERDALLADKARLDWLEKFAETGAGLYAESNSDSFDWDSRKDGALRQALDAALAPPRRAPSGDGGGENG